MVSINPWKDLPIYDMTTMRQYADKPLNANPPHVYALTDVVYRSLLRERRSQAVLVSGESGTGKTESTKFVLQYLTFISGGSSTAETLKQQILQANYILESFGNAKTIRNNNSSRFGKWIQVYFDGGGAIQGATVQDYLLEKSRVVFQAPEVS